MTERKLVSPAPHEWLTLESRKPVNEFSLIKQSNMTHEFTKVYLPKNAEASATGIRSKKTEKLVVRLEEGSTSLTPATHKLFDFITWCSTETGSEEVSFPITSLMDAMGHKITDANTKKETRTVASQLEALFDSRVTFDDTVNGKLEHIGDARILQEKYIKRGVVTVRLGSKLAEHLKRSPVEPFARALWRIDTRRYPNAYNFGKEILRHKNMNAGKPHEDRIKVIQLLMSSQMIAFGSGERDDYRHFKTRVVDVFKRDMDAMSSLFSWSLEGKDGKTLSLEGIKREEFLSAVVVIRWKAYPDQTERLRRQEEKRLKRLEQEEEHSVNVEAKVRYLKEKDANKKKKTESSKA